MKVVQFNTLNGSPGLSSPTSCLLSLYRYFPPQDIDELYSCRATVVLSQ